LELVFNPVEQFGQEGSLGFQIPGFTLDNVLIQISDNLLEGHRLGLAAIASLETEAEAAMLAGVLVGILAALLFTEGSGTAWT
jgi:hypothetical protein